MSEIKPEFETLDLKAEIAQLKANLEEAKTSQDVLMSANNVFRTLMLSTPAPIPLIDSIQLARTKNNWAKQDVTLLMQFFEIFNEHTKLFAELISAKKGADAIKQHVKDKYSTTHARVEETRETIISRKAEKAAKAAEIESSLAPEELKKAKALKGIMKSLGVDLATAKTMLNGMGL